MTRTAVPALNINMSKAEFVQKTMRLLNSQFSLADYPFYDFIYNVSQRWLLLKCGRQVAKSTKACVDICADSYLYPHFRQVYISPSQKQTARFVRSRLHKMILDSPVIAELFPRKIPVWDIYGKPGGCGAEIYTTYAGDDPDRTRGISSDANRFDEIQDMVYDLVVPVVNESMSKSDFQWENYYGTPKSVENTVEILWQQSNQCEWIMPCHGCGRWAYADSPRVIGKFGLICPSCGHRLNPREGKWHPMKWDHSQPHHRQKWGFHLNKLILPENNEDPEKWYYRVLRPYETYTETGFLNEVCGVSTASGSRLISRSDLLGRCRPYVMEDELRPDMLRDVMTDVTGRHEIYAGIDWSGEGEKSVSFTALWIWAVLYDGSYKTLYYKTYGRGEPVFHVKDMAKTLAGYNVKAVGADAGVGAQANSFLRDELPNMRLLQFQGGAFRQQLLMAVDRMQFDRTSLIDSFFNIVKRQKIYFPYEMQCHEAFDHWLAIHAETTRHGRRQWQTPPMRPNDLLFAAMFGWAVGEIHRGVLKFYESDQERDSKVGGTY